MRIAVLAFSLLFGVSAGAADFPSRPITIVVPYGAGGANDIIARQVAPKLHARFGQPVVVENKPGANGTIGTQAVVRAAPDGHTIGIAPTSVLTINPWLFKDLPYDPAKDLAPLTIAASVPNILVVHPKVPARSVETLIDYLRKNPNALSFASQGIGSTGHLSGELFKTMAKVDMTHVPYKGSAPAMADLVSGQVDLMFDNLPTALPHMRSGALRALGIGSLEPSPDAPDVPPLAKFLPGYESNSWFGFVAPAATPKEMVAALHRALVEALRAEDVSAQLKKLGATLVANTPEEFSAVMKSDRERWGRVVKLAGVTLD